MVSASGMCTHPITKPREVTRKRSSKAISNREAIGWPSWKRFLLIPFNKTQRNTKRGFLAFISSLPRCCNILNEVFSETLIISPFEKWTAGLEAPGGKRCVFTNPSLKLFWKLRPERNHTESQREWHYLLWAETDTPLPLLPSRFIIFKSIRFLISNQMGFSLIQTPAVSCPCLLRALHQRTCFLSRGRPFQGTEPKCPSQALPLAHSKSTERSWYSTTF